MFTLIWQFEVRPGEEADFEKIYGPSGAWSQLFRKEEGYLRTQLFRTVGYHTRYITIDNWTTREAYEAFRDTWAKEYNELDNACTRLTLKEMEIGKFEEC